MGEDEVRCGEDGPGKTSGKAGVRTQYTWLKCGLNAWVTPEGVLIGGACEVARAADEAYNA
jgi:hypothetical protein